MAASPFRPAIDLLAQYAQYHRDRRNIATHFIGIPLIVFAIGVLLARGSVAGVNLAWIAWAASMAPFELRIWPGPGAASAPTSSFPVASTPTRGAG